MGSIIESRYQYAQESILASFLNMLLIRDVARQIKTGWYLSREVAARGIRSKHTSVDQHHCPELTVGKVLAHFLSYGWMTLLAVHV
jgi:hypothetical protein